MTRFLRYSLLLIAFLELSACSVSHEYPSKAKTSFYQDEGYYDLYEEAGSEVYEPSGYEEEDPSVCVGQWCSCESY